MEERFSRLRLLVGDAGLERLRGARVLVAGLGGVGSPCAEALVRSGVGRIGLLDAEAVEPSNINRQLVALESTVGRLKTDVFTERARDINPEIAIDVYPYYLNRETHDSLPLDQYDVVADCIDSLVPKLNVITRCLDRGVRLVSSTGAGFKLDPAQVRVGSIWETQKDPLAHRMRKKLRRWGYGDRDFLVVYSTEQRPPELRNAPYIGSIATVTSVFGSMLAAAVIEAVLNGNGSAQR